MTKKQLKRVDSKGREEVWEWEENDTVRAQREQAIRELEAKANDYGVGK